MSVDILGTNCDQCRSMVRCCFTSTETVRLIRTGSPGRPPRLSHSSWTLTNDERNEMTYPSVVSRLGLHRRRICEHEGGCNKCWQSRIQHLTAVCRHLWHVTVERSTQGSAAQNRHEQTNRAVNNNNVRWQHTRRCPERLQNNYITTDLKTII